MTTSSKPELGGTGLNATNYPSLQQEDSVPFSEATGVILQMPWCPACEPLIEDPHGCPGSRDLDP